MHKNTDVILESEINQAQYDPHRLIFHMSLGGVFICLIGILLTVIALFQKIGLLIFFVHVDSLGDYLFSPLAYVYNVCLLLAGACFMSAMVGLYLLRYNSFILVLSISGGLTGALTSMLGIFPVNDAVAHHIIVVLFVCSTLIMFCLLVFCKFKYPKWCPLWLFVISILGVIETSLYLSQLDPTSVLHHVCMIPYFCALSSLAGLHTLLTLCGGIGLAMFAKKLLIASAVFQGDLRQ